MTKLLVGPWFFVIGVLSLIGADQLLKYFIRHEGVTHFCNPNLAFGIPLPAAGFWLWWLVMLAISSVIFWNNWKKSLNPSQYWLRCGALALILAGALSNMLDRIRLGCVLDFIDIKVWPFFNLADTWIVLGVFIWLVKIRKI